MSEKKRRFLTVIPGVGAVVTGAILVIPQAFVSDSIRGALMGFFAGCSIVALIKLTRTTSA